MRRGFLPAWPNEKPAAPSKKQKMDVEGDEGFLVSVRSLGCQSLKLTTPTPARSLHPQSLSV